MSVVLTEVPSALLLLTEFLELRNAWTRCLQEPDMVGTGSGASSLVCEVQWGILSQVPVCTEVTATLCSLTAHPVCAAGEPPGVPTGLVPWSLNIDKSILPDTSYSKLSKILNFHLHLQPVVSVQASEQNKSKSLSGDAHLFFCTERNLDIWYRLDTFQCLKLNKITLFQRVLPQIMLWTYGWLGSKTGDI